MINEKTGYNIDDQYGTYYLTMTVVGWADIFSRVECRDIIISAFRYCIKDKGLRIHGYNMGA